MVRVGENGEILAKRYKLPVIRLMSSRDLMYSMVIKAIRLCYMLGSC